MATERIVLAGFGGQGVMSAGQLLTYAGMIENKQVSWLPSYGPEMRGGAANCAVMVSDTPVGSPIITNDATSAIIMNAPSLDKFENSIVKDGILVINSSLIERKTSRDDVKAYYVPANEIANEMGNSRVVNMIMLGAHLELTKAVEVDSVLEAFKKVYGPSKEHLVPLNKEALERGAAAVR
ncbi:2-oxoacid:acceptor oxidoreductase family protein [Alkaliphilus sp. MSJ-5]|uniref:2-oxoacid:acceptor oxidoreductase family protein n=1 Tax=Alkaliphilus flagellatus TaxID=2841507 RepID=A0ABS6FX39_9FIRM|nr:MULTISPECIES: 2-oxoacid:acceptor oxidoreductase family protein [Alkaliphilus]MBU5674811.1 2-oxoacid:acceptor oxidoreductase family protein [Alkaliphilus flagellatus]QUH18897.1 2-oxoacid:acceptor oxidoreductase family protein [Alkaliphilus sp. B6464]